MDLELQHPPSGRSKRCPRCAQVKPLEDFGSNRAAKDGHATYCKPCHNAKMKEIAQRLYGGNANFLRTKRYGIDEAGVAALVAVQGGVCAICGAPNPTHVDHSHDSGEIRGMLCFSCNRGLGEAEDHIEVIRRACEYLRAAAQRPEERPSDDHRGERPPD